MHESSDGNESQLKVFIIKVLQPSIGTLGGPISGYKLLFLDFRSSNENGVPEALDNHDNMPKNPSTNEPTSMKK